MVQRGPGRPLVPFGMLRYVAVYALPRTGSDAKTPAGICRLALWVRLWVRLWVYWVRPWALRWCCGRAPSGQGRRAGAASVHVQAAVDGEVRARGIAAVFGGQPGDDGGNLLGFAQAFDGDGCHDFV